FLTRAARDGKGRILATSADVRNTIVDILSVDENYLGTYPHNVTKLIAGWFRAIDILKPGHPQRDEAIRHICQFFNWTRQEYEELSPLAPIADRAENEEFFQMKDGSSPFRKLMLHAQDRWNSELPVTKKLKINPEDADGSAILLEAKGASQK